MNDAASGAQSVDAAIVERVLDLYGEGCRYLRTATVQVASSPRREAVRVDPGISGAGQFVVARSCVAAARRGQLNAVDVQLACEQLISVVLSAAVQQKAISELTADGLDGWWPRLAAGVRIIDSHARFHRPLTGDAFQGRLDVTRIDHPEDALLLLSTSFAIYDDRALYAEVDVRLAIDVGGSVTPRPLLGN